MPEPLPPVELGDFIPGTQLRRRFQAGREVCPQYCIPPLQPGGVAMDRATEQATAHGWRAVVVWGVTYAQFGGVWYVLLGESQDA